MVPGLLFPESFRLLAGSFREHLKASCKLQETFGIIPMSPCNLQEGFGISPKSPACYRKIPVSSQCSPARCRKVSVSHECLLQCAGRSRYRMNVSCNVQEGFGII